MTILTDSPQVLKGVFAQLLAFLKLTTSIWSNINPGDFASLQKSSREATVTHLEYVVMIVLPESIAVEALLYLIGNLIGGFSVVENEAVLGGWVASDGQLIVERVRVISFFCTLSQFRDHSNSILMASKAIAAKEGEECLLAYKGRMLGSAMLMPLQ